MNYYILNKSQEDTLEIIKRLLNDPDISIYKIATDLQVSTQLLYPMRDGKSKLTNCRFKTICLLENYAREVYK